MVNRTRCEPVTATGRVWPSHPLSTLVEARDLGNYYFLGPRCCCFPRQKLFFDLVVAVDRACLVAGVRAVLWSTPLFCPHMASP